ncbi:flagellar protein FlaG [Desulfacinum hydrothermale DSM 13146]|uniref:Flagellar protein FlaG n=1 Tax=Desulfacinum hydrothermale DSM 13146 TaxID=1121390 RepID=A0A1W1X697_9BACT|nr:flagellar protein FlaG [Desulfacinum hydrothermale]SMC19466.1 flagellar protein FlaG [Desulfacinum hydrothermale DSM 13146]
METRVDGIQSLVTEPWVREDPQWTKRELIKPVEGKEGAQQPQWQRKDLEKSSEGPWEQDRTALEGLIGDVQNYLQDLNIKLSFELHEETGDMVVSVVNKETGEVIRQIPPEELLELREKLEELTGVLFNGKA